LDQFWPTLVAFHIMMDQTMAGLSGSNPDMMISNKLN